MRYRHVALMTLLAVAATLVVVSGRFGNAAEGKPVSTPKDTAIFMRAKLASSQKVLEGLVSKDFELVAAGGKELEKMSDAAAFQRYSDPVYRHYSREFRRLAGKLNRLGVDRNIEGASFTYMHAMTLCISCHEYVRDVIKVADDEGSEAAIRDPAVRSAAHR